MFNDLLLKRELEYRDKNILALKYRDNEGTHHEIAKHTIKIILELFYYEVYDEMPFFVSDDKKDPPKLMDIFARYPKKHNRYSLEYVFLGIEIDNSSEKVKGLTGHKSARAHKLDNSRTKQILENYPFINKIVRFEATDLSMTQNFKNIGLHTFLQEMGINPYK